MRSFWVVLGGVFVVAGLLLCYLPISVQTVNPTVVPSTNSIYVVNYEAPLDLLFPRVAFAVSWTATELETNISVLSCGSDMNCLHPAAAPLAIGEGPSGNLTFLGWANRYYEIQPTNGSITIAMTYATPVLGGAIGFGLLLAGIALVSYGFTARRKSPAPPEDDLEYIGSG